MTFELIKAGGDGVISVASNIVPDRILDMAHAALDGRMDKAEIMNNNLSELFKACFIETNPIPIKTALAMKGMCREVFRLPLCTMEESNKDKLRSVLEELNILGQ